MARQRPRTSTREPDPAAPALEGIYRRLEEALAGSSCPRSTRCCRFRETGRTPYLWPVEARRVLVAIGRLGGRLPQGGAPGDCPLIKADGGCSIYADRPFGCRTYFCQDATLPSGSPRRVIETEARTLRALSDAAGESDLLPLSTILAASHDPAGRRR